VAVENERADSLEVSGRPLIQTVIQLNPAKSSGELLTPLEAEELTKKVLIRVAEEVGRCAVRVRVLRNLSAIVVEADDEFQACLARQPEVATAMPNESNESLSMPPVRKHPIEK
jgi:hypothetical protein